MFRTPFAVLAVLACITAIGIGVALIKPGEHMAWVFWGSAQLLPIVYILLAWWGSSLTGEQEPPVISTLLPDNNT